MKFLVSSAALLKLLTGLNGVISTHPVVPILDNFHFQLTPGKLVVTASDLETSIVATLAVETPDSGAIAVPARLLLETLKNLPDQPVTFVVDEDTYAVTLKSANGRYKLAGENAADFPRVAGAKSLTPLEMPSSALARAIAKTVFAASTDDLRPAMTGLLVQLKAEGATFVATDGHRLLRYSRMDVLNPGEERSVILPRKACLLLQKVLPTGADVPVKVAFSENTAFFGFNNVRLVCRLIDERYPAYESVIPTSSPNVLVINRAELLGSVKRMSIYSNKTTHQIRLQLGGAVEAGRVLVSAEDLDFSNEASETLTCEYGGEPIEIGYNARFLMELLNNLDTEHVQLAMSTPNRAGLLSPVQGDESEDLLMLVMPVMLNNYV